MKRDNREGMPSAGGWITPEMMHERAARIMHEFDLMARKTRDLINEGKPIPPSKQTKRLSRYRDAHWRIK